MSSETGVGRQREIPQITSELGSAIETLSKNVDTLMTTLESSVLRPSDKSEEQKVAKPPPSQATQLGADLAHKAEQIRQINARLENILGRIES